MKINHLHNLPFGKVFRCRDCDFTFTIFDNEELPHEAELMWGTPTFFRTQHYTLTHNRATERARLKVLQRLISEGKLLEFGANVDFFMKVCCA